MNIEVKSNLAKLLATENIIVQHNKVKTASFDVKNRILTLPIFKEKSGDVYDMLIAHECSHALFTPYEEWEGITDGELRSYVNVIEDTRIDKLIQAKYPGVVKNYMNGFDILEKKNFFGLYGKDVNKDLMIIDKINIRSKSLNRVPFDFNDQDKEWLSKVDSVVTFKDVIDLAKEMLAWQKEQVEEMAKLPNFDELEIVKAYDLGSDDDFDDEFDNQPSGDQNGDQSDEQNDFNNFGDEKADDEQDAKSEGASDQSDEKSDDQGKVSEQYGRGAGGDDVGKKLLKAVTDQAYEDKKDELLDAKAKGFVYGNMPEAKLDAIVGYKQFLKEMQEYRVKQRQYNYDDAKYMTWLKGAFKKFQTENKKTVMYLVKEFEMKKAATAYKRASTDKTGIIDPLKLPNYKFSDDIFKRLTIVPDGKNHGMMMLLDWSGSMSDTLMNTVEQLLNLVEFVKKVNIPFEVYFFTSERSYGEDKNSCFEYKDGDWMFEDFNLVNCFSHRMTKKEFELAGMYMYHMAQYYNCNYVYHKNFDEDLQMARYNSFGVPSQFYLGNTPLNEALVFCNKLVPMFKSKYGIEKMTFITLTDGGANSFRQTLKDSQGEYGSTRSDWDKTSIINVGKKKVVVDRYGCLTSKLLKLIKVNNDANVIGFYILKRVKRWDIEQYIVAKDYSERAKKTDIARKQMTKDKAIAVDKDGYDKYFLLDGKRMKVENFNLNDTEIKRETVGEFKRMFGKAMQNRLVSRVVLNKFIQEVA